MKQNPFQAMITKAMAAVLCAALWHGAVQAADPVADYMLYYSGERDFCLHLLKNADKAEKIAPVIGPTYAFNLDVGERHAPKTRLYFVKSPMPGPFIYRMRKERNWKAILGYTPWEADSTAGRIVYDSRWRKYDDQCPGLFQIRDYRDPNKIADTPTQMSLYDFDADGDGKHDMIYRYMNKHDFVHMEVADFRTCTLKPIISQRLESDLYRFEGKNYLIGGSIEVFRINTLARKIDPSDRTCYFAGIDRFTDYSRHIHPINKLKYRR